MKKMSKALALVLALALVISISPSAMAETREQTVPKVQELIDRLEQADGQMPADFDYDDLSTFMDEADPETVQRIMSKIMDNAPPMPMPEANPNQQRSAERSNVYKSYDPATQTEQTHSFDNSDPNTTTMESKGLLLDIPSPDLRAYPDFWFERSPQSYYDTRSNVRLTVYAKNGKAYAGSGFLIANNYLLTAAHLVYDEGKGGWCESITVSPGHSEDYGDPYGITYGTNMWRGNYPETKIIGDDWAIVELKTSFNIGYLGMMTNTASEKNRHVRVQGYPANIWASGNPSNDENQPRNHNLFLATGEVTEDVSAYEKWTNVRTYMGMSGGPVLYKDSNNDWCVGGITVYSYRFDSAYCAFDNNLYNAILDVIYR